MKLDETNSKDKRRRKEKMRKIPYRVTAGVLSAIMLAASMPIADVEVFAAQTNVESTAEQTQKNAATDATKQTETAGENETAEESNLDKTTDAYDTDTNETTSEDTSDETANEAQESDAVNKTTNTSNTNNSTTVTSEETATTATADTTYPLGTGTYANTLAPATYSVPLKMFKFSTNTSNEGYFEDNSNLSMAGSCVSEPATIVLHEDGTATMTVKLGTVSFAGAQGYGSDWSIYQDYDNARTSSATVTRLAAQIDAYSRVTGGEEKYVSQITFKLPQTDRNGAYVHMYIEAMGSWQDALFALNWKDATRISDATSATSTVEGEAVGGSYLAAIGSTTYDNIDTAVAELTEGKTLRLNGDATLSAKATIAGGNIDLNGHILNVNDKIITLTGDTVISDSSTAKSGTITNTGSKSSTIIKIKGNVTLSGITDTVSLAKSETESTLVIEKSSVTGNITYTGGDMTIRDTSLIGNIKVTGGGNSQILLEGANQFTSGNSSAVIQAEYGDDESMPANIIINDGTYVTEGAYAIEIQGSLVRINGGYFKASQNAILGGYDAAGKRIAQINGGTYSGYFAPQEVSASNAWDYAVKVYNADGTLAGGLESDGVDSLFGLLQDGQTAVLEKDIAPTDCMKSSVNATIDLNGHAIDGTEKKITPLLCVTDKTLRVKDTSEAKTGLIKTYKDTEDISAGAVVCTAMATTEGASPVCYLDHVNTYGTGLATFVNGKVIVRGGYHDQEIVGFYVTTATLDIGESTWKETTETGQGANDYGKLSAKIRKVRYNLVKNDNGTYSVEGTALGKALEKAEQITEKGCTKASWEANGAAFQTAYNNALEITSDAEETEVETAVAELNSAMEKLVMAASEETMTSLTAAIATAKAVDSSKYTAESYQNLQTAIETAEEMIEARASETDAATALNALNAALNALVAKTEDATPSDTQTPDNTATGDTTQTKEVTTPGSVKATAAAYNQIKLTWTASDNATGYEVYQKNGKTFKKIATVKTTSYTVKKLTTGTKYTFKVRAYGTVDGKKTYSGYTKTVSAKPAPAAPQKVAVKNSAKKTAKLSWKKVAGADGYEVYRSNSAKGKYKKIATGKSGKSVSYTSKKLSKNKTYYYKVRAYKNVKGKKVYGSYSKVVKVKIKK